MMGTNPEDVRQATATLNACGIKDKDATTALAHVLRIAGDVSYDEWLNATREQINGAANDEERDRRIASRYGHDAVRAVLILAHQAKGVS